MTKWVYFFGAGETDGQQTERNLVGGKGANLAEMVAIGIPVPGGFTITTEACVEFYNNGEEWVDGLEDQIKENIGRLEKAMGATFGGKDNPLLLAVRSGARVSMPGMMDTVLNLGLNDETVEVLAERSGNARFAWDSYRRFIQMYGDVVMGVDHAKFEEALAMEREKYGVKHDNELSEEALKDLVNDYKKIIKESAGELFPNDPFEQLRGSVDAVFRSWNTPRAIRYRQINHIPHEWGTAVNVQAMVYGNMGENSGTGVAFTRDPSTGENVFYGEYLMDAQGEDVVAGIRTPHPISDLAEEMPEVYDELVAIYKKLEAHYKEMQDVEFTIQEGKLYMLQTRAGKRTATASVRMAVEMVEEGLIDKKTAVLRVDPAQLDQLLHPMIDPDAKYDVAATGLPASPGAAAGRIVFSAEDAEEWVERGETVILVRNETSPEDIGGMDVADGILTARGGMTSHAAVVARGMGKCCVAGCHDALISYANKTLTFGDIVLKEGDWITLNGTAGEVIVGQVPMVEVQVEGNFGTLMEWADEFRALGIRTNADTPQDSETALGFGAEGIGLCRTEHMFFEGDRVNVVRQMIFAGDKAGREEALAKLLPYQKGDFKGIFEAMKGLPVTIRLLDPPLHEFVPHDEETIVKLAKDMGLSVDTLKARIEGLEEVNPMLGHRGCRLGITYPEIYAMQARAIFEAAAELVKEGQSVLPEVMIPLIGTVQELQLMKDVCDNVAKEVMKEQGVEFEYLVGTMIEIPRACLIADSVAEEAEFFSFGTNDLTQMGFGFSRDDAGTFLPEYVNKGILSRDPFQSLDQEGIGALVQTGVDKGRSAKPNLKVGVCGEHGGDPSSIDFFHRAGLDYVSCSPYRVPIARLSAAQANIRNPR